MRVKNNFFRRSVRIRGKRRIILEREREFFCCSCTKIHIQPKLISKELHFNLVFGKNNNNNNNEAPFKKSSPFFYCMYFFLGSL
jgi:hypothetical protein